MEVMVNGYLVLIDAEDLAMLDKWTWNVKTFKHGGPYLCRYLHNPSRTILFHRELMNPEKYMEVDHADMNTLNNQKENLRVCTISENRCNCGKRKTNRTGYKGVCFNKWNNKYQASIQKDKVRIHIGYYPTAIEAAKAYREKAIELHKEFAHF